MRYERVHVIWDLYDGVRTGIADLDSIPHYFVSQYDDGPDEYSDNYKLHPVGPEFMRRALRCWEIYRAWERKFHSGEAALKTHPGFGGVDSEYDELRAWLDSHIARLGALSLLYRGNFRELPGQEGLPGAMLREMEVAWLPSPT